MAEPTTVQKAAAEVIGTFILVFFGCSAVIVSGGDYVAIALAFGLAVLIGAYAFGRVSGAHFNPAVTVGAALAGRMAWRQTPVYIVSQLAGALIAGLTLFILVQGFPDYDVSVNGLAQSAFGDESASGYAMWAALLMEVVLTMVFVWVILAVTDARNEHPALAPLAIGLALTAIHLAAINASGASVNPVRSLGVAVFAGTDAIAQVWLYIIGPLVGGAIAAFTYPLIFGHGSDPVPGSGLNFGAKTGAVPGYGAPDQYQQEWNQGGGSVPGGATQTQAWEQEPIIQDGWQWDHQAQEWKPLEQWQPPPPPSSATPEPTQVVDPDAGGDQPRPPG